MACACSNWTSWYLPGLGTLISILIAFGGLAFNIGNIAGAGLGLNAMFGLDIKWGAAITAIFSILIFVSKSGQKSWMLYR